MIKSNELRIGNWLIDGNGGYYQVEIADLALLSSRPDTKECSPIPLSAEILEKAGFKLEDDGISPFWKLVLSRTEVISIEDDWSFGLNAENENSSQGLASNPGLCQYVHQLQNLYFALTGEELTVTL